MSPFSEEIKGHESEDSLEISDALSDSMSKSSLLLEDMGSSSSSDQLSASL